MITVENERSSADKALQSYTDGRAVSHDAEILHFSKRNSDDNIRMREFRIIKRIR